MTEGGAVRAREAELEVEFPPKPEFVRMVRQAVSALARLHGADEDVVENVKLAVSEACNTAIAQNALGHEPLVIQAQGGANGLIVDVMETGPLPDHEVSGPPGEIDTDELPFDHALAVPIIRGLVDELTITPREGGGSVLRMRLSLGGEVSPS